MEEPALPSQGEYPVLPAAERTESRSSVLAR
jgi:hypothetical protein